MSSASSAAWSGRLDQREQCALLVADVRVQPTTELVDLVERRRRFGGEIGGAPPEVDMLDQHANDRGVRRVAVAGEGGEQNVLLDSEVLVALRPPRNPETRRARRRRSSRWRD